MAVVLGVVALAYQGVSYVSRASIIDIGRVQVTADREVAMGPVVLGVAAVAGGIAMWVVGSRTRPRA
jgi:hypothetical protein